MKKDEARAKAWADWHSGMKLDDMPPGNPLWDIAFDAGWDACEAAAKPDQRMDANNRASMAAQAPSGFDADSDIPFSAHHRGMENLA